MRNPRAVVISLCLSLPLVSGMSGCIIWDAYEQVELANKQLGSINATLEQIETTNVMLEHIQENLTKVDTKLGSIDTSLGSVDTQLSELQVTLNAVSESLESLRKTINNIDSTIPFLNFSGDDEETQDQLEAGDGEEAAEPTQPVVETPAGGQE